MKFRHKLLLSVCAGFLAMLLYSGPMWWGPSTPTTLGP